MSLFKNNSRHQIFTDGREEINKKQKTILWQTFLKAGIGFVVIGILAFVFGQIWINSFLKAIDPFNFSNRLVLIVLLTGIGLILVSCIVSSIWLTNPFYYSFGFTLTVWILFILCESVGFSLIIFLFSAPLMLVAFGIAAAVCFIFSIIGYSLSQKTAITIQKAQIVCSFIAFGLLLASLITSIVLIATARSIAFMNISLWIYFITFSVMLLLLILSLMQLVSQIKASSEFAQIADDSDRKVVGKISWFFGYILLCQFIQIVWFVIYILIIISRFRR